MQVEPAETFRGVVSPAQCDAMGCDAMGHMNVQHYVAAFDQAMWRLAHELGYQKPTGHETGFGWADVRHVIDYRSELPAGALYRVASSVRRISRTSLVTFHRMTEIATGVLSAECEMTSVYFDLSSRTSSPIPEPLREVATSHLQSQSNPTNFTHSSANQSATEQV